MGLVAGAAALGYGLLAMGDVAGARAEFGQLFASSKLVHVSTIDFAILSAFFFEPIREDMARRGWWSAPIAPAAAPGGTEAAQAPSQVELARLAAFCFPVLGPAAYVLLRPALPEGAPDAEE